jgi:hypothetical protein
VPIQRAVAIAALERAGFKWESFRVWLSAGIVEWDGIRETQGSVRFGDQRWAKPELLMHTQNIKIVQYLSSCFTVIHAWAEKINWEELE